MASSVSGTAGRLRRPALSGRMWSVSWQEAGPLVTGVVRCDPVVRGPDVAPMWPQRSPSLEGTAEGQVAPPAARPNDEVRADLDVPVADRP
jgi:hypothetical protein